MCLKSLSVMLAVCILISGLPVTAEAEGGKQLQSSGNDRELRILAWGSNDTEQLGSNIKESSSATTVWSTEIEKILKPNFDVVQIEGGQYLSCLLRSDKTVWCWGGGNSHSKPPKPPAQLHKIENLPPIKRINMGSSYTYCAISDDDQTWCWGQNNYKAKNFYQENSFGIKSLNTHLKELFIGMRGLCGRDNSDDLHCWGDSYGGIVKIPLEKKVIKFRVGFKQACAVLEDASVSCWKMAPAPKPRNIFTNGEKLTEIMTGWDKGCALKDDRTVWCWRSMGWSDDDNVPPPTPVKISDDKVLSDIVKLVNQGNSLFCALRRDGTVWCWDGPSGDPSANYRKGFATVAKSPDGVCNLLYVSDIAVGSHTAFALVRATKEEFYKLETECALD